MRSDYADAAAHMQTVARVGAGRAHGRGLGVSGDEDARSIVEDIFRISVDAPRAATVGLSRGKTHSAAVDSVCGYPENAIAAKTMSRSPYRFSRSRFGAMHARHRY